MPKIISNIVEVCVFSVVNKRPKFLILKRAKNDKLYPLAWQIISGRLRKKEKALNGALREMNEEIGLAPKNFWVCPHSNLFLFPIEDEIHATSVFVAEINFDAKIKLSAEHDDFLWSDLKRAKDKLVWPGQIKVLDIVNDFIISKREASRWAKIPTGIFNTKIERN